MVERYAVVRRFAPAFLASFTFRASRPNDPFLSAVEVLRRCYAEGRSILPKSVPTSFLKPRWRKVVFPAAGAFDRRAYEIATLVHLRDRLGSGGVWVDGSRAYRTLDDYLLPPAAFEAMRAEGALGLAVDAEVTRWLAERRSRLARRMSEVERAAAAGDLPDVVVEGGELIISPLRRAVPEVEELKARLYGLLLRARVPVCAGHPRPRRAAALRSGRSLALSDARPLVAGPINVRAIEEHWDETLCLAASIKAGTVIASTMLNKLAGYPRQNPVARALREIGRVERTLFLLHWMDDPELRRRTSANLNKGEARDALARAVFFNRLGELRDRTFENQRHRASRLNLVASAIILWNAVYLGRAVDHLRHHGGEVPDQLLAHVAPLGWEHVSLTSDYLWGDIDKPRERFRPLRTPASAGRP